MSTSVRRVADKASVDPGNAVADTDPLSALPSDLSALVERYGSARGEVIHRIEHGSAESVTRAWQDVRQAEKRLAEALNARGVKRQGVVPADLPEIEIRGGVIVSLAGCTWWKCARCGERLMIGDTAYFNIDQRVICGRGKPCNLATGKGNHEQR